MKDSSKTALVNSEKIQASYHLNELSGFFSSILDRLDSFKLLDARVKILEKDILDSKLEDMSLDQKISIYEKLGKLHIMYVETVRKVLGQIDLNQYMRAAGLMDLLQKFQHMSPESLSKINRVIEELVVDESK